MRCSTTKTRSRSTSAASSTSRRRSVGRCTSKGCSTRSAVRRSNKSSTPWRHPTPPAPRPSPAHSGSDARMRSCASPKGKRRPRSTSTSSSMSTPSPDVHPSISGSAAVNSAASDRSRPPWRAPSPATPRSAGYSCAASRKCSTSGAEPDSSLPLCGARSDSAIRPASNPAATYPGAWCDGHHNVALDPNTAQPAWRTSSCAAVVTTLRQHQRDLEAALRKPG